MQKLKNLVLSIFLNFSITLLATCGCTSDFLNMLPKIKIAAKVLLKFKMAATDHFHFFLRSQKRKNLVVNYSNFTITFPTIWRCACDFFTVLWKLKMAAMHELHNFLWTKLKSEIMCRLFYCNLKWPPQVDFLNLCDHKNC